MSDTPKVFALTTVTPPDSSPFVQMREYKDGSWVMKSDYDALKAQLAAAKEKYYEALKILSALGNVDKAEAIAYRHKAEAERDALRADAERYRYLRKLWKKDHFSTEAQPDGDPDSCDAAIDAAKEAK